MRRRRGERGRAPGRQAGRQAGREAGRGRRMDGRTDGQTETNPMGERIKNGQMHARREGDRKGHREIEKDGWTHEKHGNTTDPAQGGPGPLPTGNFPQPAVSDAQFTTFSTSSFLLPVSRFTPLFRPLPPKSSLGLRTHQSSPREFPRRHCGGRDAHKTSIRIIHIFKHTPP